MEQLDKEFTAHVDRMFAMEPEEKVLLPTRLQWETNRKEKEELEKWTGNVSIEDMLKLHDGNPAAYFRNQNRKLESEPFYCLTYLYYCLIYPYPFFFFFPFFFLFSHCCYKTWHLLAKSYPLFQNFLCILTSELMSDYC